MNTKSGKAQETEAKSFQFAFTSSFKRDLQVGCRELAQRLVVQLKAVPGRRSPRRGSAWLWAQQEGGDMGSHSLICLVFDLGFWSLSG